MKMDLREYYSSSHPNSELQKLYYNMSTTIKYIHEQGYCVRDFNLKNIEILNSDNLTPIQYKELEKIPFGSELEYTKKDIYNLSFLQIGIYSNTLDYLKPQFLKENFQLFAEFLPQEDVPYHRGVVERGAAVYYCDYVLEKSKRQMDTLQKELGEDSGSYGIQKSKRTAVGSAMADRDTRNLYSSLDDRRQAAFTNFLILPFVMIVLGVVLSVLLYLN